MSTTPAITTRTASRAVCARLRDGQRGSAAVEYVGLAMVISMLMTAVASAVDSAFGDRLARALVERLLDGIAGG